MFMLNEQKQQLIIAISMWFYFLFVVYNYERSSRSCATIYVTWLWGHHFVNTKLSNLKCHVYSFLTTIPNRGFMTGIFVWTKNIFVTPEMFTYIVRTEYVDNCLFRYSNSNTEEMFVPDRDWIMQKTVTT